MTSVFGLKGMAIAAAIGLVAGAYAGYRITNTFDEAKALRLERDALNATIAARDETIARNARLTTGVNNIAIGVNRAIAYLREAASDEALTRDDPVCRYSDDEFGRVQSRIDRAARPGAGLPAVTRP
ncbi:hypothetical protein [Kaistia terrae]|uniref:Uncharacterized protein n=1 Tax=Kaistia terrae TaxID=537017 RepID=A0ABW0Q5C7_9HYPH|nr:hypothetical protein [Kaistia terrae]MCX5581307.1 hypothetical protein [Kaistia terrae]